MDGKDVGSISDVENNSDDKSIYIKADFSTYNVAGANVGANVVDTSGLKDADGIGGIDDNLDNKNTHAKASFSN